MKKDGNIFFFGANPVPKTCANKNMSGKSCDFMLVFALKTR